MKSPQSLSSPNCAFLLPKVHNFSTHHLFLSQQQVMDRVPEQVDQFDRLPDELLLLILNRVHDARSLTQCLSVSKRFGLLVPHVSAVFLAIPRRLASPSRKPDRGFPLNFLAKTVRFLRRAIMPKPESGCCDDASYYDPDEILKRFTEIRSLNVEIPRCGREIELRNRDGFLLRWVAEFGSGMNSCTIFGADSLELKGGKQGNDAPEEKAEPPAEPILSEKDLKLRVVWIISCLIAAASRHVLLKEFIAENPKLEDVQMTDAGKQGKLWMGKEQIAEVRSSAAGSESKSLERNVVPDLKMQLWFVPEMELPETGFVMKGATLVVIRPAREKENSSVYGGEESLGDWFGEGGGEDGDERGKAFGEAVREMRKMKVKSSFTMEMNSF